MAGLRLRRVVAGITGADLANVLVAGYSNGYLHYTTTPEEYTAQEYEGGSTLFGRWQLPALCQTAADLARAMRDGAPAERGVPEPPPVRHLAKTNITNDLALAGHQFGDVLSLERSGGRVTVRFVAAHPGNDLRRGGTFAEVERFLDGAWTRVADDGDWSTRFYWARSTGATSVATVVWDIPDSLAPGRYRLRYHGDTAAGPFTGATAPFDA